MRAFRPRQRRNANRAASHGVRGCSPPPGRFACGRYSEVVPRMPATIRTWVRCLRRSASRTVRRGHSASRGSVLLGGRRRPGGRASTGRPRVGRLSTGLLSPREVPKRVAPWLHPASTAGWGTGLGGSDARSGSWRGEAASGGRPCGGPGSALGRRLQRPGDGGTPSDRLIDDIGAIDRDAQSVAIADQERGASGARCTIGRRGRGETLDSCW